MNIWFFFLQKFQQLPNLGLFRVTTSESVRHSYFSHEYTYYLTACSTLAHKRSFSNYLKYHYNGQCSYLLSQGISVVQNALYIYTYYIPHEKNNLSQPTNTKCYRGQKRLPILNMPTVKHVMPLRQYKDKQFFCGHKIFQAVCQCGNLILTTWVTTNCRFVDGILK